MARLGRLGFLGVAVVFHLIYLYSIFDIYFVSPIVHGMKRYGVDHEAPAKRLFLIVGDGLRADKCFQSHPPPFAKEGEDPTPRPLAPFLRSKVLNEGTFGVSHTRVPTESRPGHVAIIAGLYEDVSAVTTGWKSNPVNFDSVFNRSRHTWSWGSPDILPMFAEGAVPGRVDADSYSAESEDWTADSTELDIWVFDRVKALFERARTDKELSAQLREDKIVFFLHLLGLDTAGHASRPYSPEYLKNIQVVDAGVKEIVELVTDFYGDDGGTSWVFTADHGMSDWGSHGDGHPDNTRTPLVAWGAGISRPKARSSGMIDNGDAHDEFSSDWGLDSVRRNDVNQADIAALMAYLVGLEFPANSVGELPINFLDADDQVKAKALFANAKQILEMYFVKQERKRATNFNFQPYKPLASGPTSFDTLSSEIETFIETGRNEEAIAKCVKLIKLGLAGLRYLQTYDWLFLRTLVTLGYLGWIAFALVTVIDLHVLDGQMKVDRTFFSSAFFSSVLLGLYGSLAVQKMPPTYYAYAFFPVLFWEEVWTSKRGLLDGMSALFKSVRRRRMTSFIINSVAFIGLLEAMVLGYFRREVFTICFLLACFWPLLQGGLFVTKNMGVTGAWVVCCICMSSFTLLPVGKQENLTLILIGGTLVCVTAIFYLNFQNRLERPSGSQELSLLGAKNYISKAVLGLQIGLVVLSMVVTSSSVVSLRAKQGLPLGNQVVGWLVLVASLLSPALHKLQPQSHYLHRFMVVFLAFAPIFVILSISYECLFYVAFWAVLVLWVELENRIFENSREAALWAARTTQARHRNLSLRDVRLALFFFFLIQVAFFGTGNVASLSSFSLESVTRLIPVFDPFAMGALLVFKLLIPFAALSANLGILNRKVHVAPSALFMIVMAVSDILTLNFFYLVKDEGSWLEIGTTISHFCIASLLCVFVSALEFLSEVIVDGVVVEDQPARLTGPQEPAGGEVNGGKLKSPSGEKSQAEPTNSSNKGSIRHRSHGKGSKRRR